ncbi:cation:proton antiporter subunit C [Mobilitalea sibirica]|uniref:Cation:proton antiporter subunit C n=1 Tax=Mobilitalea sibirica TaxID=1462919 RepID=A0A8J7HBL3_9FIRM|nr:cation:proton antiporter subunit C [Mobilitalea sibirica]MBH1939349.1 cation:proton antiporter subunit C [Mobilitalea sibirica]
MDYINGETIAIVLFFIGVWGLIARRNVMKTIISIGIMQTAVILYYISGNYIPESVPPIEEIPVDAVVADPLPQALMITEIVIGAGITAASLVMFIHVYHKYGTSNWLKLKK